MGIYLKLIAVSREKLKLLIINCIAGLVELVKKKDATYIIYVLNYLLKRWAGPVYSTTYRVYTHETKMNLGSYKSRMSITYLTTDRFFSNSGGPWILPFTSSDNDQYLTRD